jgi:hypothetical protein
MVTTEQKGRLAHLLRDVALGITTSRSALEMVEKWSDIPWKESLFSGAYHQLTHFDADEDIRCTNSSYAKKQVDLLLEWANRLEAE